MTSRARMLNSSSVMGGGGIFVWSGRRLGVVFVWKSVFEVFLSDFGSDLLFFVVFLIFLKFFGVFTDIG